VIGSTAEHISAYFVAVTVKTAVSSDKVRVSGQNYGQCVRFGFRLPIFQFLDALLPAAVSGFCSVLFLCGDRVTSWVFIISMVSAEAGSMDRPSAQPTCV